MRYLIPMLFVVACARPADTPLVDAVRNGRVSEVQTLIARGADPNAPSGVNDWPPLIHAVHKNQLQSVEALLDGGADVDRGTAEGLTPLMMAAAYDNKEMTELLLARGANPRAADKHGKLAIDHAVDGAIDLDRMTFFRCNQATAAMLEPVSPEPRVQSLRWARMKRCG